MGLSAGAATPLAYEALSATPSSPSLIYLPESPCFPSVVMPSKIPQRSITAGTPGDGERGAPIIDGWAFF